jgi:hypothetical protein
MPRYDKKCTICSYMEEMSLPVDHLPVGCKNPKINCPGVMETVINIKTAPFLTRAACPTRNVP